MLINEIVSKPINNASEAEQIVAVRQSLEAIRDIINPSEAVQLAAVTKHGAALFFIKKASPAVIIAAINENPYILLSIKQQPLTIMNACKASILKYILELIRDLQIRKYDHSLINAINYTNWPELRIIKKSLDAVSRK